MNVQIVPFVAIYIILSQGTLFVYDSVFTSRHPVLRLQCLKNDDGVDVNVPSAVVALLSTQMTNHTSLTECGANSCIWLFIFAFVIWTFEYFCIFHIWLDIGLDLGSYLTLWVCTPSWMHCWKVSTYLALQSWITYFELWWFQVDLKCQNVTIKCHHRDFFCILGLADWPKEVFCSYIRSGKTTWTSSQRSRRRYCHLPHKYHAIIIS